MVCYLVDDLKLKLVHERRLQLEVVSDQFELGGRRAQAGEEQRFEDLGSFFDQDGERLRGSEDRDKS